MSAGRGEAPLITGIGVRLPGAKGLAGVWRVLAEGRCTVGTVSARGFDPALYFDPQPGRRGKTHSLAAGQLDDVWHFDPAAFAVSPREAAEMDPQQRQMLMAVREAVDDAGLDLATLAGPRTGVFVGSSIVENLSNFYYDPARGGSTFTLGNTLAIIANRVSASFDFGGPSQVIDTACSSALTALDTAAGALRRGELDVAVVGGVHVVRTPGGFVGFSQARMLSPTGACRAFDASADGYVRSEAAIALVLMRAEVAERLGARQRARLLASGVNTDGAASPLVVPASGRQQALIEAVLEAAGRDPDDFAFYEAHGTGTQVGDPAEARAIGGGLAILRRAPLPIGSAKTNFGHTEPAAGLVGLVKAVLALEHRALPASLHFHSPNPGIDFEGLNLAVNTSLTPLDEGARLAGVNAFGFGGTNAVALVERVDPGGAPTRRTAAGAAAGAAARAADPQPWLLLSAASAPSLAALAGDWARLLADTAPAEHPRLAAAAARRTEQAHRLAVPLDAAPAALAAFAAGEASAALAAGAPTPALTGRASFIRPRTVFAFPGNGAQVAGMGRAAYAADPAYRAAFDAVAEAFAAEGVTGLAAMLALPDLAARLASPLVAQPLLVACQVAQARSLAAAGLAPAAVIGHSLGELPALHIAGSLDLAGLARVVASRSRAFEGLRGQGTMATLALGEAEARRALAGLGDDRLALATVNGPRSVTVSGPEEAIARLARMTVGGRPIAMVRLGLEVPYHSPALDPLRERFFDDIAGVSFARAVLPVAGSAVGRMLRPGEGGAAYLWKNARDTVRFADAVAALAAEGPVQLVEISPQPILASALRDIAHRGGLPVAHFAATATASGSDAAEAPGRVVARAWSAGARVDRARLAGPLQGPPPELPAYPWDLADYYAPLSPDGLDAWGEVGARHLAGRRPDREQPAWTQDVTPTHPAWLADHRLGGAQVLPGAALVECALAAAAELWPGTALRLEGFDLLRPAEVAGDGLRLGTRIDPDTGALRLDMRPRLSATDWTALARGTLAPTTAPPPPGKARAPSGDGTGTEALYAGLAARGLRYGPAFRRLERLWPGGRAGVSGRIAGQAPEGRFVLDPTALDAGFHALGAVVDAAARGRGAPRAFVQALAAGAALVPARIGRLTLWRPGVAPARVRLKTGRLRRRAIEAELWLDDAEGRPVAHLEQVEFTLARLDAPAIAPAQWLRRRVRLRAPGSALVAPRGWADPLAALDRLGAAPRPAETAADRAFAAFGAALGGGAAPEAALADLLAAAPDLADDARLVLARRRGAALPEVARATAASRHGWALAEQLIEDLLARWRPAERCGLRLIGLPPDRLVARLAGDSRVDALCLWHPDADHRAALRRLLPPALAVLVQDAPAAGRFELAVQVGDSLGDALAEGAAALVPGAIVLDIDPTRAPDPAARYVRSGPLSLRLRAGRLPGQAVPPAMPALRLLAPVPQDLPAGLVTGGGPEGGPMARAVILRRLGPQDSPEQVLAETLLAVRQAVNDGPGPLTLVALEGGAPGAFAEWVDGLAALVATLANEAPGTEARLIAVAASAAAPDWAAAFALSATEPVVHCSAAGLAGERLVPLAPRPEAAPALALAQGEAGQLDGLGWRAARRRAPGPGEVEIAVAATGLNFRDAMLARGLLPERLLEGGASGAGLGMECAGRVLRAGPGARLAPGTEVVGFASAAFASHLTLPEAALVALPAGLTPESGASLPVAFVTAWEALVRVARIAAGDWVLVHGGAGGVGLAAVQVARLQGARVIASASTPERRALARAAGAQATVDSRDPSFADAVRAATGGAGVDVVLNSLAGAAMRASVGCLAPFGRFIELGKRDFLEGTRLDLAAFAAGQSYHGFDLDRRLAHDPRGVAESLAAVSAALAQGRLTALPVTHWPGEEIAGAMRHMLAARHVGKIVITPPAPSPGRRTRPAPLRDDWVILGGTGGVGLALARALVAAGVARVHLVSRSGQPGLGTGADGLWAQTAPELRLHAADATDRTTLGAVFDGIDAEGRRLGGVVHAAMVLHDRPIRDLDPVETRAVIDAKLGVARALDAVLRARAEAPDHVLFLSSIAARLGNPGQAAYGAANAAVEALAAARRRDGLPGQVLGLGPIGDGGVLARNAALGARLNRLEGLALLPLQGAVAEILAALGAPAAGDYLCAAVRWDRLAEVLPGLAAATFERVVPAGAGQGRGAGQVAADLAGLDWPEALARVENEIAEILCAILRLPRADFDPQRPLGRYGIDSLMAMELRLEVERRLGLGLAGLPLSEATTPARLAVALLGALRREEGTELA